MGNALAAVRNCMMAVGESLTRLAASGSSVLAACNGPCGSGSEQAGHPTTCDASASATTSNQRKADKPPDNTVDIRFGQLPAELRSHIVMIKTKNEKRYHERAFYKLQKGAIRFQEQRLDIHDMLVDLTKHSGYYSLNQVWRDDILAYQHALRHLNIRYDYDDMPKYVYKQALENVMLIHLEIISYTRFSLLMYAEWNALIDAHNILIDRCQKILERRARWEKVKEWPIKMNE